MTSTVAQLNTRLNTWIQGRDDRSFWGSDGLLLLVQLVLLVLMAIGYGILVTGAALIDSFRPYFK